MADRRVASVVNFSGVDRRISAEKRRATMLNFISCKARSASLAMILIAGLTGCATESHQALETAKPASAGTTYTGTRSTLMVGKFDNQRAAGSGIQIGRAHV